MQYSKVGGVVRWSGGTTLLSNGQSIDDDHPLLAERPDLFSDEAPGAQIASSPHLPQVERATQAPGERRSVRVPKPQGGSAQ